MSEPLTHEELIAVRAGGVGWCSEGIFQRVCDMALSSLRPVAPPSAGEIFSLANALRCYATHERVPGVAVALNRAADLLEKKP